MSQEYRRSLTDPKNMESYESDSEGEEPKDAQTTEESQKEEMRRSFYRSFDDNVKVLRPSHNQLIQEQQTQNQEQGKSSNPSISRGSNRSINKSNEEPKNSDVPTMDNFRHYLKTNYQATLQQQRDESVNITNSSQIEEQVNDKPLATSVKNANSLSFANVRIQSVPKENNKISPLVTTSTSTPTPIQNQISAATPIPLSSSKPMTIVNDTTRMTKSLPDLYGHLQAVAPTSTIPTTPTTPPTLTIPTATATPLSQVTPLSREKSFSPQSTLNDTANNNLPLHEIPNPKILEYIQQLEAYIQYQNQQAAQLTAQLNLTTGHFPYTEFSLLPFRLPGVLSPTFVDPATAMMTNTTLGAQPAVMIPSLVPTSMPIMGENLFMPLFTPMAPSSQLYDPRFVPSSQPIITGRNQGIPVLLKNSSLPTKNNVPLPTGLQINNNTPKSVDTKICSSPITKVDSIVETNELDQLVFDKKNDLKENTLFPETTRTRVYSFPIPNRPPFCVWLGNMPSIASNKDVIDYLAKIGVTLKDIRWGRRQGAHTCCYVDFHTVDDMKKVLETVDAINAPPFMCRQLKIDINEGIRVDRKSAVTAVTRHPMKNKNIKRLPSNDDIHITNGKVPPSPVSNDGCNASQSASCLFNVDGSRRKE